MNITHSLLSLTFAMAPALALQPVAAKQPDLSIDIAAGIIQFDVELGTSPFLGVVLLSLSSDLQHFLVDLPPLLDQAVILDYGLAVGGIYSAAIPETLLPPGIMIYAQGVAIAEFGILASEVDSLVLDSSGEGSGAR
jgi:hypothetical protein